MKAFSGYFNFNCKSLSGFPAGIYYLGSKGHVQEEQVGCDYSVQRRVMDPMIKAVAIGVSYFDHAL